MKSQYDDFYCAMMSRLFGELQQSEKGVNLTDVVTKINQRMIISKGGDNRGFSGVLTLIGKGTADPENYRWGMYDTNGSSITFKKGKLPNLLLDEFFNDGGEFRLYSFRKL